VDLCGPIRWRFRTRPTGYGTIDGVSNPLKIILKHLAGGVNKPDEPIEMPFDSCGLNAAEGTMMY